MFLYSLSTTNIILEPLFELFLFNQTCFMCIKNDWSTRKYCLLASNAIDDHHQYLLQKAEHVAGINFKIYALRDKNILKIMWKRPNLLYPRNDSRGAWTDIDWQFVVVCLKPDDEFYCKQICGAVSVINTCPLQGALSHQHSLKPTAGTDHFVQNTVLYQLNVTHSVCIIPNLILFIYNFQKLSNVLSCVSGSSPLVVPFLSTVFDMILMGHTQTQLHTEASNICFVDTLS